ncbi:hypothetical protein Kisp02_67890 [Kineosporia sp. NBRC 101731]|nr:hypothetical protein Kisp02_67890 [Kineosporia sp. NBRC 101731]
MQGHRGTRQFPTSVAQLLGDLDHVVPVLADDGIGLRPRWRADSPAGGRQGFDRIDFVLREPISRVTRFSPLARPECNSHRSTAGRPASAIAARSTAAQPGCRRRVSCRSSRATGVLGWSG